MADNFAFCFKYSFPDLNKDFAEKNAETDVFKFFCDT